MKNFVRLVLIAWPLVYGVAHAATVNVTWTPPTTNTDGSAIPATGVGSLTTYRIEYGTCNGTAFGTKAGEVSRTAPATGTTLNLQPGTTCVRVFVSNTYGSESAASNVASKVVNPPVPNPPGNLTVTDPTAYNIRLQGHDIVLAQVIGKARMGATCGKQCFESYCPVARTNVKLATPQPNGAVMVARCG